MRSARRTAVLLIVAALVAVLGRETIAGKGNGGGKPGGGGGDPAPAGVIYFSRGSISPDGTGETSLPGAFESLPSYELHGGQRWFVKPVFDGADNPDGRKSSRIVAVSEDGATEVDLTPSSASEWRVAGYGWWLAWAKDDSFLSFTAVEWFDTGALDAKSYIFKVGLDWTAGEPALVGAPTKIVEAGLEGSQAEMGFAESQIQQADWEPGGDRVVYWLWASQGDPATSELRVYTLSSDTDVLMTDGGIDPEWAPSGGLIAYSSRRDGEWGIWATSGSRTSGLPARRRTSGSR